MTTPNQSSSFHIDVDEICNSLHVDRGSFIAATKRSLKDKAREQQNQQQQYLEDTPPKAPRPVTPDNNNNNTNRSANGGAGGTFPTSPLGKQQQTSVSAAAAATTPGNENSNNNSNSHLFSKAVPIPSGLRPSPSNSRRNLLGGGGGGTGSFRRDPSSSEHEPLLGGGGGAGAVGGSSVNSQNRFGMSLASDHVPNIKIIGARTGQNRDGMSNFGSFRKQSFASASGLQQQQQQSQHQNNFTHQNEELVTNRSRSSNKEDSPDRPHNDSGKIVPPPIYRVSPTTGHFENFTNNSITSAPHQLSSGTHQNQNAQSVTSPQANTNTTPGSTTTGGVQISSKLGDSPAIKPRPSPSGGLPSSPGLSHENLQGLLLSQQQQQQNLGGSTRALSEPTSHSNLNHSLTTNSHNNTTKELTIMQDDQGELTMGFFSSGDGDDDEEDDTTSSSDENQDEIDEAEPDADDDIGSGRRDGSSAFLRDGTNSDNYQQQQRSSSRQGSVLGASGGMGSRSTTPRIDGKMINSSRHTTTTKPISSAPKFTLPPPSAEQEQQNDDNEDKPYLDEEKIKAQQEALQREEEEQEEEEQQKSDENDNNNNENYDEAHTRIVNDDDVPPHPASQYNPRAINTQNLRSALHKSPSKLSDSRRSRGNSGNSNRKNINASSYASGAETGSNLNAPQGSVSNFTTNSSNKNFSSGKHNKKQKKHVRFSEDVIEHVKVEQNDIGGVIVKVSFRRPPWLYWILTFSLIVGAAGWFILLTQAHRAAEEHRPYAVWKLATVRSWTASLTAILICAFAFPPKSTDKVFARDISNIARLVFTAFLFSANKLLVYLSLTIQLTIAPLIIHGVLPMTFVIGIRYFLALCGMSSANTTWYDKLSAVGSLVCAVTIPIYYGYSKDSGLALLFAGLAAISNGGFTWKRKSIRPYFSQGIVAVCASVLTSILISIPLVMPAVRECHIPALVSNSSSSSSTELPSSTTTTLPPATTTTMWVPTTTSTPAPPFSPEYNRIKPVIIFNMDSDAFILALLAGVCEGLNLFGMGLILGFLDVPAKLAFNGLAVPLYIILFAVTPNIPKLNLAMSLIISFSIVITVAIQIYFGESHRRETHFHLNTSQQQQQQQSGNDPSSSTQGNNTKMINATSHQQQQHHATPYPDQAPQFPDMDGDEIDHKVQQQQQQQQQPPPRYATINSSGSVGSSSGLLTANSMKKRALHQRSAMRR